MRNQIFKFICVILLAVFCISVPAYSGAFVDIFEQHHAIGTLVIERQSDGKQWVHNSKRAELKFVPASTFKIPHALFALHLKAVASVDEVIPWDGVVRPIRAWNKSQDMTAAVKNSTVPFFQEIARRIELQPMEHLIEKTEYGNRIVGEKIDRFWLDGPLKISAVGQIDFLKRLNTGSLPFSKFVQNSTIKLINRGQSKLGVMFGKTGWSNSANPPVGWFVGWLETKSDVWFFALNMKMERKAHRFSRVRIVEQALLEIIEKLNP